MAILSLSKFLTLSGITSTDATRDASLTAILLEVDAAIKRAIYPFVPESSTLTDKIIDAPHHSNILTLPVVPVRSITSIYLHPGANGDASLFTSDDLLTANTDYYMPLDDPVNAYSRSGRVFRRGVSIWGVEYRRPLSRLSHELDPDRGAIKFTAAVGPSSVPADIEQAAFLMTALIYARRTTGLPFGSESWNGYSASNAGPFTATGALYSPDIKALLSPYMTLFVG